MGLRYEAGLGLNYRVRVKVKTENMVKIGFELEGRVGI